jgi:DNA-binding response OmpR family regulator
MSSVPDTDFILVPERFAVRFGRREVAVSPTQFRLLVLLLSEPGRVFSRAELIERVFGTDIEQRTVDVHVKDLRRNLGLHGFTFETVRGRGYRYAAPRQA